MNNLRLSIQEIADLKEGRRSLEEIEKTHDGTSMGTIGPILDELCRTKGTKKQVLAFDENGKRVYKIDDDDRKNDIGIQHLEQNISDIDGEKKNLHGVVSENRMLSGRTVTDIRYHGGELNIPNYNQLKSLCTTNEDGDYLLRSYTMISDNNSRMTFIKNNNFDKSNHKDYRQICKDIGKESKKYNKEYNSRVAELVKEKREAAGYTDLYIREHGITMTEMQPFYSAAEKQALKEVGSWEDRVMKEKGFIGKLENCNVKFRMGYKYTRE